MLLDIAAGDAPAEPVSAKPNDPEEEEEEEQQESTITGEDAVTKPPHKPWRR